MSDTNVYIGTTNFDGTGSSENLNSTNASNSVSEGGIEASMDGTVLTDISDVTTAVASSWNADGEKEVSIDNDSDHVFVKDFVDVDIDNSNDDGSTIQVVNAKRGTIDTADGDDDITVSVYSNMSAWVNNFDINTNDGDDHVTLVNSHNSQNTSFNINLGSGSDSLDVSDLLDPYASSVTRVADGGEGTDTLTLSGQDTVSFENFEVVIGTDHNFGTGITVDSDLLDDNDSSDLGLIFSNVDISLADDVTTDSISDLSDAQMAYLTSELGHVDTNDYVSVTLTDHDGSDYTIITDDADYSALA